MPRATRSQKPAKASQGPSQTQRSQKRRVDEEEEEEEGRNMDVDDEEGNAGDDIERAANALVRLAMFTEHKRVPLRRDEISKKVLGSNTRSFARVFAAAQVILRSTLGMELVELRSRAELDDDTAAPGKEADLEEARKATGVKKKAAAAGSKTYILRSTLHATIIAQAAIMREEILEAEAADAASDDDDDDDDDEFGAGSATYGSILSWSSADQVGPIGILYVILALILVGGRVLGDADLRMMLKRLRLPAGGSIPFSAAATHRTLTLDSYLTMLIRQGFLDRQQVGEARKGAKGKRARVAQADEESGQTYEWRWGARAQSEVGEQAIAEFVAEFMVGDERQDEEEEEGAAGAARAKKRQADVETKLARMTKGIERAAGGKLSEIK